ncbi:unnamed protein product, partial [Allacma fusca]
MRVDSIFTGSKLTLGVWSVERNLKWIQNNSSLSESLDPNWECKGFGKCVQCDQPGRDNKYEQQIYAQSLKCEKSVGDNYWELEEALIPKNIQKKQGYLHRASDWDISNPDWYGKIVVFKADPSCHVQLEDRKGDIYGQSVINEYPGKTLVPVLDSSRYFTLNIQDIKGNFELVGIGFSSRNDSKELTSVLTNYFVQIATSSKRKREILKEEGNGGTPAKKILSEEAGKVMKEIVQLGWGVSTVETNSPGPTSAKQPKVADETRLQRETKDAQAKQILPVLIPPEKQIPTKPVAKVQAQVHPVILKDVGDAVRKSVGTVLKDTQDLNASPKHASLTTPVPNLVSAISKLAPVLKKPLVTMVFGTKNTQILGNSVETSFTPTETSVILKPNNDSVSTLSKNPVSAVPSQSEPILKNTKAKTTYPRTTEKPSALNTKPETSEASKSTANLKSILKKTSVSVAATLVPKVYAAPPVIAPEIPLKRAQEACVVLTGPPANKETSCLVPYGSPVSLVPYSEEIVTETTDSPKPPRSSTLPRSAFEAGAPVKANLIKNPLFINNPSKESIKDATKVENSSDMSKETDTTADIVPKSSMPQTKAIETSPKKKTTLKALLKQNVTAKSPQGNAKNFILDQVESQISTESTKDCASSKEASKTALITEKCPTTDSENPKNVSNSEPATGQSKASKAVSKLSDDGKTGVELDGSNGTAKMDLCVEETCGNALTENIAVDLAETSDHVGSEKTILEGDGKDDVELADVAACAELIKSESKLRNEVKSPVSDELQDDSDDVSEKFDDDRDDFDGTTEDSEEVDYIEPNSEDSLAEVTAETGDHESVKEVNAEIACPVNSDPGSEDPEVCTENSEITETEEYSRNLEGVETEDYQENYEEVETEEYPYAEEVGNEEFPYTEDIENIEEYPGDEDDVEINEDPFGNLDNVENAEEYEMSDDVKTEEDYEMSEDIKPEGDSEMSEDIKPEGDSEMSEDMKPEGDSEMSDDVVPKAESENLEEFSGKEVGTSTSALGDKTYTRTKFEKTLTASEIYALTKDPSYKYFSGQLFHCHKCSETFNNARAIKCHWTSLHKLKKSIYCQCGLPFPVKLQLDKHKKKFHPCTFFCMLCNRHFNTESDVDRHLLESHDCVNPKGKKYSSVNSKITCENCFETFHRKYKFMKHWRAKHREQVVGEKDSKMEESDVKSDIEESEDLDEQDVDKDAEFRVDPVSIAA